MFTNLLTEDNLPSYHRVIAQNFTLDDAWGYWVGRWTAEENKHSVVMRDYLVVTRGVDPVALEEARMDHMTPATIADDKTALRVRSPTSPSRNSRPGSRTATPARSSGDPIADRMLARVAADENLHMLFYRNIVAGALDLTPDQTIKAIARRGHRFQMPGASMPGFRRNSMLIAKAGIYDLPQHHDEVVEPVLRKWNIFDRTDFGPEGEQARDELATFLDALDAQATKFVDRRAENRARVAARDDGISPDIAS